MQIRVSKSKAIQRLCDHKDAIESLRSLDVSSREFKKWRADLFGLLKYVFGEGSREMSQFRSISFSSPGVRHRRQKLRKAYQCGLANSEALIDSLIGQVEDFFG